MTPVLLQEGRIQMLVFTVEQQTFSIAKPSLRPHAHFKDEQTKAQKMPSVPSGDCKPEKLGVKNAGTLGTLPPPPPLPSLLCFFLHACT